MTLDHGLHILELFLSGGGLFFIWKGVRSMSRFTVHLEEYPLHRHVGKEILYPKGQTPEETKHMGIGVGV